MHLPPRSNPVNNRLATIYDLPDLAVFEVSGTDAISFLQGQITNDIAGTAPDRACLAGYCTPQGRLLATMVLNHVRSVPDSLPVIRGVIRRDILGSVLKRLSMFVMRAKARLSETELVVRGVALTSGERAAFENALGFELPVEAWQTSETASGLWIAAPTNSMPRWWLISGPEHSAPEHSAALAKLSEQCIAGDTVEWLAQDIETGLPWVEAATQDLFIPQTLNLDLIQGVSFTKGCYPGQEIVARSHYRGTVKRRMVSAIVDPEAGAELLAGVDVYDGSREDQVCGRIINIARTDDHLHVLLESSFEAVDHQQLRALSPNGPALQLRELPYSVRPEQSKA
jgi:folate-binding protein YgfZ